MLIHYYEMGALGGVRFVTWLRPFFIKMTTPRYHPARHLNKHGAARRTACSVTRRRHRCTHWSIPAAPDDRTESLVPHTCHNRAKHNRPGQSAEMAVSLHRSRGQHHNLWPPKPGPPLQTLAAVAVTREEQKRGGLGGGVCHQCLSAS